jgi:radical SAM protein with 4Fe4S-binding SPASM domain
MSCPADDPYTAIEKRSLREFRPLRAMLELTYRCNFRCAMCYLVDFRSPGELTTEELAGTMDQLAAMGCLVLTFTGGEPLLRKDFFELAEHARSRRFALRIFTNGTRIDEAAADRLARIRPLSTEVSLYGMSDETYRAVTGRSGPGECARVQSAIRMLTARGLPVQIKVPVIRQNYGDLDRMVEFAREVGAKFVANPNITPRDDGDLSPLAHALDDAALEEYFRRYVTPRPERALDPDGLMCNTARNSLVISPMGDVFPCVQIKRAVGNVRERPLAEIWRGAPLLDRLRALRVRDYAAAKPAVDPAATASRCPSAGAGGKACGGQCAGIAAALSGSYTGRDPLADRLARVRERAHAGSGKGSP